MENNQIKNSDNITGIREGNYKRSNFVCDKPLPIVDDYNSQSVLLENLSGL